MDYQANWTVSFEDPSTVKQSTLTGNLLANNSDQRILSISVNRPYSLVEENGELKIIMNLSKVNKTELLSVNATVLVSYDNRSIRAAPPFPYDASAEMPAETGLTAATPEMAAKAAEVVNGSTDALDAITRLENFVHRHMHYNLAYEHTMLSAAEAYALGEGVCDEYSHLFISMAKSVGIPARMVTGYVHTGESWGPHGWAEAYVPGYGWLPVDPTYNEILNLDATHLRIGSGNDQSEISERVMTTGTHEIDVKIEKGHAVTIASSENFAPFANITMNASRLEQGENLTLGVENLRDSAAFVPVKFIVQPEVSFVEGNDTVVYVAPQATVQKSYLLLLPELQQKEYYGFSVVVESLGSNFGGFFMRMPEPAGGEEQPGENPAPPEQPGPPQCALASLILGFGVVFALSKRF